MKAMHSLLIMTAVVALLLTGIPANASEMDSRIESSARNSYVFKTYLTGDDVRINSRDGVVTLTGTVAEESHKSLAQETVEGLPGVKKVDNRLSVKGEQPAANSDKWLSTKVLATLLLHKNVSASRTKVSAANGIVTLRGEADSEAQRELTTEYAKSVEGVKDVKNEMTVPKSSKETQTIGEKIDDASITAQVKMALLYHRSTSALNTSVKTNEGVVTVGGKARNAAEKDLVSKLVKDIKGVKSVNNLMSVEE